jgi:hypothetical protein
MAKVSDMTGDYDVNDDGSVDLKDALKVVKGFGGTDPALDANADGAVDLRDVLAVLDHFGEQRVLANVWPPQTRVGYAKIADGGFVYQTPNGASSRWKNGVSAPVSSGDATLVKDEHHMVGISAPNEHWKDGVHHSDRGVVTFGAEWRESTTLYDAIPLSTGGIAIVLGYFYGRSDDGTARVIVQVFDESTQTWTVDTQIQQPVHAGARGEQMQAALVEFNGELWMFNARDGYQNLQRTRYTLGGAFIDYTEQYIPEDKIGLTGREGEMPMLCPTVVGDALYLAYQCAESVIWEYTASPPKLHKGARVQLVKIAPDGAYTMMARTVDWAERCGQMYLCHVGDALVLTYFRMASATDTGNLLMRCNYNLATDSWGTPKVIGDGQIAYWAGEGIVGRVTDGYDLWLHRL